ncbi:MAG: hypothetical protein QGI05_03245 [Candidatus Omnitrophota bacterium]|jgi:hypothetical protein|nr:hypothetical protein [Candidatus Omnitrophota bacterium]
MLAQIENLDLGVKFGTHPTKIVMFYLIAIIIGLGIYFIIEHKNKHK